MDNIWMDGRTFYASVCGYTVSIFWPCDDIILISSRNGNYDISSTSILLSHMHM